MEKVKSKSILISIMLIISLITILSFVSAEWLVSTGQEYVITSKSYQSYLTDSVPNCEIEANPGEGFVLEKRECVFSRGSNNGGTCFADVCLWAKESSIEYEYTTTHSDSSKENCDDAANAPLGYVLKKRLLVYSEMNSEYFERPYSQLCLWEKQADNNYQYTITHRGASPLGPAVDCRTGTNPGEGFVLEKRECLYNNPIGCTSDLCLWKQSNGNEEDHDKDDDGVLDDVDCDDNNPNVWQILTGYVDSDNDGFGIGNLIEVCSGNNLPQGYVDNNQDCDDNNPSVWQILQGYLDNDNDGFGAGNLLQICSGENLPESYVNQDSDCNDSNNAINPSAVEICDSIDNNCDGIIDENCIEPDITPPASISGLHLTEKSFTYLAWSWENPSDSDFFKSIIFLNGIEVSRTSDNFYKATGLEENTAYTINIHTVDTSGNINNLDVTNTAKTLKEDDDDDEEHVIKLCAGEEKEIYSVEDEINPFEETSPSVIRIHHDEASADSLENKTGASNEGKQSILPFLLIGLIVLIVILLILIIIVR